MKSQKKTGLDEGAPGTEVLDSNDDMDEVTFEIPGRIRISGNTSG